VFVVSLAVNGKKIEVVLDDYFPTINGAPAFSRGNGPELWVLVLEKAFAKIYGSY
jgi:calpain-15